MVHAQTHMKRLRQILDITAEQIIDAALNSERSEEMHKRVDDIVDDTNQLILNEFNIILTNLYQEKNVTQNKLRSKGQETI